jgi:hypothetical protein
MLSEVGTASFFFLKKTAKRKRITPGVRRCGLVAHI